VVNEFAMRAAPGLRQILKDEVSHTRRFYLVRHADDRRLERMNRFAEARMQGLREELVRLEALT
jgi:hypothetical protein